MEDDDHVEGVNGRGWEMVPAVSVAGTTTTATSFSDELSVFPPCLHEGLAPTLILEPIQQNKQHQEHHGVNDDDDVETAEAVGDHVTRTPPPRGLVDLVIELVRSKLSKIGRGSCNGGAFWSFAAVGGMAGVLMYARRRHRRERELLLLLLLEKDQSLFLLTMHGWNSAWTHRGFTSDVLEVVETWDCPFERINQLMDQIVKMSEIVAANHRIPVLKKT